MPTVNQDIDPLSGDPVTVILGGRPWKMEFKFGTLARGIYRMKREGWEFSEADLAGITSGEVAKDPIGNLLRIAMITFVGVCGQDKQLTLEKLLDIIKFDEVEGILKSLGVLNDSLRALTTVRPKPGPAGGDGNGPDPFPESGSENDGQSPESSSG